MGTTQRMARFIADAKFEDVPTPAVNLAKLCLLDAVGCAIYGTTRPLGKIITELVDELGGKPAARVRGTRIATYAVNAALANGTLGHSEDFDDYGAGHQAVLLMPTVLALGEELRARRREQRVGARGERLHHAQVPVPTLEVWGPVEAVVRRDRLPLLA